MKKAVALILLSIICFSLCACDPGTFSINREELNAVVSVELIEYANPNQKHFTSWVPNHFGKLLPFDSANAKTIEVLSSEKIPDFLDAFSKSYILHTYYAYNSPKDVCVRLNYQNGNFLIIWANYANDSYAGYIGEYASDGTVLSFWGCFSALSEYTELVNEFFDYQLE